MELVLALVVIAVVAAFVTVPLRKAPGEAGPTPLREELEARRDAKYRQIRDAELDREQGKLSQGDWERADAELRAEAIEILRELDRQPKEGPR